MSDSDLIGLIRNLRAAQMSMGYYERAKPRIEHDCQAASERLDCAVRRLHVAWVHHRVVLPEVSDGRDGGDWERSYRNEVNP